MKIRLWHTLEVHGKINNLFLENILNKYGLYQKAKNYYEVSSWTHNDLGIEIKDVSKQFKKCLFILSTHSEVSPQSLTYYFKDGFVQNAHSKITLDPWNETNQSCLGTRNIIFRDNKNRFYIEKDSEGEVYAYTNNHTFIHKKPATDELKSFINYVSISYFTHFLQSN